MAEEQEAVSERRKRQRFVAKRRGEYCFWVVMDERRLPLQDLSLEGFGVAGHDGLDLGYRFSFVLQRLGVPDEIRGTARVVNRVQTMTGELTGVLFEALEGDGASRIGDWLTAHVLATASVPISEKEASRIVSGPSLI
ncbi:MAG: PilZ domain-containing protein [Rhodocyclaceae bacterium]